MSFTGLELLLAVACAYLGIMSARSNIYLVLDWMTSRSVAREV